MRFAGTCRTTASCEAFMPSASSSSARNLPGWIGSRVTVTAFLVIVGNLDVERPFRAGRPFKTDSPLLIDTNAELTEPVASQRLKAIVRKPHKISEIGCSFQNVESSFCLIFEAVKLLNSLTADESLGPFITILLRGFVIRHCLLEEVNPFDV